MPGVSTNTICACLAGTLRMPAMRLRVVCGLGVTMASFSPHILLSNVDLPTLGRPTSAQNPARGMGPSFIMATAMSATASSFAKSLFFGLLPEEMIFPYPQTGAAERENLRLILESLHKFAAEKIDSKKIDEEAQIPRAVLDEM